MMGLLHVTGNFKAYLSGSTVITPNSSISPTTATFDKKAGAQADITVTMTLNGNTFVRIENGGTPLTSGTDYTVNGAGTEVTLKKEYFAAQPVGETTLTFYFSAGSNRTLTVTIEDTTPSTTISPTTATFDKKEDLQADITVTMNLYGNTFDRIQNVATTLTSGTNYTVSGSTVTLKKEYLAAQPIGTTTLTFYFSGGVSRTIAITIKQTPEGGGGTGTSFDFTTLTSVDVEYDTQTNAGTLTATIQNGALRLEKTGGHSSKIFVLTFDLGDKSLSNFTGVRYEIRGVTGDYSNKQVTIEVHKDGSDTFGAGGTNTALVAQHQINPGSTTFLLVERPFVAGAPLTRGGKVKIAFGLNNTPAVTYEIKKIELYP
jgi:hypothetical protein